MRRERPAGPWTDVATAIETEITLVDQPRSVEFEYRTIAINKTGDGGPGNTVVVVLYQTEIRRERNELRSLPSLLSTGRAHLPVAAISLSHHSGSEGKLPSEIALDHDLPF